MAKRITVTATQPLSYEGRSHVRGSVFEATPVDAASLKYRGKVRLGGQLRAASGSTVPDHPSIARRMEPVQGFTETTKSEPPMPANETPVEQIDTPARAPTTEPAADPSQAAPGRRSGRGRSYQRRDMQAESSTAGE